MSSSKVLKRMWSEMKANFKDMLSRAKAEDKIPNKKELEEYQSAVQDFVDIFDTIEGNVQPPSRPPTDERIHVANETAVSSNQVVIKDEPTTPASKAHVRKDKPNAEDKRHIWSVYTSNDRQFFTQHHAKEIGLTLHRRAATVLSTLQTLIDADPDHPDTNHRYSPLEDEKILARYTNDLADSYNSEGAIIADLSKDLGRSSQEIRSRLRYLKAHSPPQKMSQPCTRPYSAEEDKFVNDLTLTAQDVSLIIGRGVHGIKKRRWTLKKGSVDNAVTTAQQSAVDNAFHSGVQRAETLPVVEADKKASLWFEDKRFSSQPSLHPDSTQSTSLSSSSKHSSATAKPIIDSNKRRKTAADFMRDAYYDPNEEDPQSLSNPTISTVTSHPRDIEVIVLSDESPPPSSPRVPPRPPSPPPLSIPLHTPAHNNIQIQSATSYTHHPSYPAPNAGWGTSSREVYCPPPPRHGSVIKPFTKSHAYFNTLPAEASPALSTPVHHRSVEDVRAQALMRFTSDLEAEGMTVLQPRMAQDQMLAIVMGCMLQRHSNNNTPAPDCHTIAKEVFELTSTSCADLGLVKEVMTCSYTTLVQIVNLLDRAGCLCALYRPPNHQGLQLAEGMKSFTALCRRHDAYLENRMGSDASLLRELLWPRDEHEERRRSKMDALVRLVMRRLAWD